MSRQNRNQARDQKIEDAKRDIANNNERSSRQQKEENRNDHLQVESSDISGLDSYRLNDLYERSSS